MSYTLYYSPGSCSLAPHIVLNEIGETFTLRNYSTAKGKNFTDEYLSVNPKGLIPTLQSDDFVMTENPAILAYLGRTHPEKGLYPVNNLAAEARCLELLAWSSNTVHVSFAQIFRPERYVLDEDQYQYVNESGRKNYTRCLNEIEAILTETKYAIGDQFSVVDPFWLVFYRWGQIRAFGMKENYPIYTNYAEKLCERPSVIKALETEQITVWKV